MPKPLFNATEFTGSFLFVQLSFPNLYLLSESALDKIDTVVFNFNDTQIFVSNDLEISQELKWSLRTSLPIINPGLVNNNFTQALVKASNITTTLFQTFMTANFIANILMAVSLQELWGTLNILQLVLHTPLNQIKLTNVAFNFCNGLIEIVNF